MWVFLGMAGCTGRRRAAILVGRAMASRTGCLGMPTNQRVVGQIVIEADLLERNQCKFAAMMFAMTGFARLRFGRRLAMKPLRLLDVGCDTLVTGKALSVLCLFCKR